MEELLVEIKALIARIGENAKLSGEITFKKVEYSKSKQHFCIYFHTKKHQHPIAFLKLLKALEKENNLPQVEIILVQSDFYAELCADPELYAAYVKDILIYAKRSLLPFAKNMHVEGDMDKVVVRISDRFVYETCAQLEIKKTLDRFFMRTYGVSLPVSVVMDETVEAEEYTPQFDLNTEFAKKIQKRPDLAVIKPKPAAGEPRQTEQRAMMRTRTRGVVDIQAEPTPIIDLQENLDVCIQGEIVSLETVSLKEGKYTKYKFDVYDKTSTVTCWFIESANAKNKTSELLGVGRHVKVLGNFRYDTFEKGQAVNVVQMCSVSVPKKSDDAPKKRVELHIHTKMSAQDAVCSAADVVKRAAEYGHPAVAITDHGVVQAFPEASGEAKKQGIKLIYGTEGYLANDEAKPFCGFEELDLTDEYVVFDLETTGLNARTCEITEIGAVRVKNGVILDSFNTFVKIRGHLSAHIVALTGITEDMLQDAPDCQEALRRFCAFCGNATLVAHNARFDLGFIHEYGNRFGIAFAPAALDTVTLSKAAFPELTRYRLDSIAKHLKIHLEHHRAVNDAACTAKILLACFDVFQKRGISKIGGVASLLLDHDHFKNLDMYHVVLLCKNKLGLSNLYRLISEAHLNYFYRKPRMLKSLIRKYREGLIIGSACEQGELYRAILHGEPEERLKEIARFYDYLEIQPLCNNAFMVQKGEVEDIGVIQDHNRLICRLGEELGIPVVATCDAHFLDREDKVFREILFHTLGYEDTTQADLYFRTTEEMLREFEYLGEDKAYEVVVENTNKIAEMTEEIELFQKDTAMPIVEGAAQEIEQTAYRTAKEIYGDPLPEIVYTRLKRELDSIISNGFSVLYWSAAKLVKKSLSDGYLVGSRGSVGSSLAATMLGITEVNPLPPHYICRHCKHSDFDVDINQYGCGVDMPPKTCPVCGEEYTRNGYNIPFEVFLGINADKVPDIDLNFSGDYQPKAHKYTEELFGSEFVFRAGTISTIKDRTAYGYVKNYIQETGKHVTNAEINRLVLGITGVKRTTGQHPGGLVIVPKNRTVYEFTAVQHPADDVDAQSVTTHFDFNSMHDILVKLDILGHDVPTIIRHLQDITGMDPLSIPLDDQQTMQLFSGLEPLHIKPEDIMGIDIGTLGIPEFGTRFVRQMLKETRPKTMAELVRISGLSHGTDVWIQNAQDLIQNGTATLSECICTRDDIMNYLVSKGVDKKLAFFTMESVRKGKWAKGKESDQQKMEAAMRDAQVEEWFIESCRKIKYMFPKAHAVAYVVMAYRIAYCKVHYMPAFYATYFTVRAGEFDGTYVLKGKQGIADSIRMLESKGKLATANEQNMIVMLEVACEMYARGLRFLPVDLMRSDAKRFTVEEEGIRMPFLSIPKLGENAANALAAARSEKPFISVEDLKKRGKVSSAVIEEMQKMGTLAGLSQSNQLSLFDVL